MPLSLKQNSKIIEQQRFTPDKGIYKVKIGAFDDKQDEKQGSMRLGWWRHSLRLQLNSKNNVFVNLYYQNKEGDLVPDGHNYLLELRDIAKKFFANNEKKLMKLNQDVTSTMLLKAFKENEIYFYVTILHSTKDDKTYANISTYTLPVFTLEEAEKLGKEKDLPIFDLWSDTEVLEDETITENEDNEDADFEENEEDDL